MSEDLRPVVFELLAAISYMQSKNLIPPEIKLDNILEAARKALQVELAEMPIEDLAPGIPMTELAEVIVQAPPSDDNLDIASFKICANCGNRSDKIVHLKKRPPTLQCQACGFEYPWPHRWG